MQQLLFQTIEIYLRQFSTHVNPAVHCWCIYAKWVQSNASETGLKQVQQLNISSRNAASTELRPLSIQVTVNAELMMPAMPSAPSQELFFFNYPGWKNGKLPFTGGVADTVSRELKRSEVHLRSVEIRC